MKIPSSFFAGLLLFIGLQIISGSWAECSAQSAISTYVSASYHDCMKCGLPCECQRVAGRVLYLVVKKEKEPDDATTSPEWVSIEVFWSLNWESITLYAMADTLGAMDIYDTQGDSLVQVGTIRVVGDSGYLSLYDVDYPLVKLPSQLDNRHETALFNVAAVNSMLKESGSDTLESIVDADSLLCYCYPEDFRTNLIFSQRKQKDWTVSFQQRSLIVRKVRLPSSRQYTFRPPARGALVRKIPLRCK